MLTNAELLALKELAHTPASRLTRECLVGLQYGIQTLLKEREEYTLYITELEHELRIRIEQMQGTRDEICACGHARHAHDEKGRNPCRMHISRARRTGRLCPCQSFRSVQLSFSWEKNAVR